MICFIGEMGEGEHILFCGEWDNFPDIESLYHRQKKFGALGFGFVPRWCAAFPRITRGKTAPLRRRGHQGVDFLIGQDAGGIFGGFEDAGY